MRVKQPYSTSVQQISSKCDHSSLPHVQEFVELGDICVFQENVTPKGWNIGRITQFANYKESLKSNRQYKSSKASVQSNVGALCTWFEHSKENDLKFHYTNERSLEYIPISESYACTLTQGCFQEVTGTTLNNSEIRSLTEVSVLNTTTQFTLHDKVVSYINTRIEELLSLAKTKSTKITTRKSSRIVNTKDHESDSKRWVACDRIRLSFTDKRLIETDKCLNDMHIACSCAFLKKQFPSIKGLQSPILQKTLPISNHNNIIQVIFLEKEKHWAVISTLNSDKDVVYYYDSVYSSISLITQQVIVNLLKPTGSLTVKIKNVCKQIGGKDCGLYALAFCTDLAHGHNPCSRVYNQQDMRYHLKSCLEEGKLTPFPISKRRRLITEDEATVMIEICPVCILSDDGDMMVFCEICHRWYHKRCVPPFNKDNEGDDWTCEKCS